MKPEIYEFSKFWGNVVKDYRKIDILLKDNKIEEAEKIAYPAWASGLIATMKLSDKLKISDLSTIAESVFYGWRERTEKHYTPKQNIEWIQRALKKISDALPPDTFTPLE